MTSQFQQNEPTEEDANALEEYIQDAADENAEQATVDPEGADEAADATIQAIADGLHDSEGDK